MKIGDIGGIIIRNGRQPGAAGRGRCAGGERRAGGRRGTRRAAVTGVINHVSCGI